jgi:hypothetical protein
MGVYYLIANHDKKEMINLYLVTANNRGSFTRWSIQNAILNVFLGIGYAWESAPDSWAGRWAKDRIEIQNDATTYPSGEDADEAEYKDAGMMFLADLQKRGVLNQWVKAIGWEEYWAGMCGDKGLKKWKDEQAMKADA